MGMRRNAVPELAAASGQGHGSGVWPSETKSHNFITSFLFIKFPQ